MNDSDDYLFDVWEDALLDQVVKAEELALSSIGKPPSSTNPSPLVHPQQPLPPLAISTFDATPAFSHHHQQPLPSFANSTIDATGFSPPRELSQRPTTYFDDSNKDLEIERLKRELGRASKQVANLEKECLNLKRERDKKDDQLKIVTSKNEEENACTKCSETRVKDFGTVAPDHHGTYSKFQNGVASNNLNVETNVKAKRVETEVVSHQDSQNIDLPYLDLSQKLLAIWGSPTDKKLGSDAISKLLVVCQGDFHILFGHMSMSLPSEITQKLLTDINSSGVSLYDVKDCFHTPEASKVSHLYHVLTKIADGTDVLETLIEPLLDLCDMKNVVVVHSSLCILHTLLKLILESETNFGRRDNVLVEGICVGKDIMDSGGLEREKDRKLFSEEILHRKEGWNHQNALQSQVNGPYLFEIMHQIALRITEESVRAEVASILKLLLLRSNAYFERDQFSQKIVFKTISEFLKKDAGLRVRKHALRLLYLVLNCPKLLASFCCGCKEEDDSGAMVESPSSAFENFKIILQGMVECVVPHGGSLLELKISRNAILVLAFLASSGQPGFDILVGRSSKEGVNYIMFILQLLVSEMNVEAGVLNELPEIYRERTFLIREILILLNRLVSSPSYSAAVLPSLTNGWTVDAASRLSRKGDENKQQDSMVKHIRTEIVDLARLLKKRIFTYLGDEWL